MPSAARLRTGLRSPRTRPPRARVLAGARSIRTSFWRHSASRSDSHNRQTGLAPSALPGSAGPDWRRQGLDSSTPALGTRSAALATQSFQTCPSGVWHKAGWHYTTPHCAHTQAVLRFCEHPQCTGPEGEGLRAQERASGSPKYKDDNQGLGAKGKWKAVTCNTADRQAQQYPLFLI
eukprot:CAMPEP_0174300206 /NCGR_PEP_ID=MMETSP0809-20121228/58331_1 /TAXON_ID=73025 ORGANISM="Eutreptiella gymnastica-like, Strain CCMP1594" /NCGR_SAMPLE_ID=MMETSP0809 /ASSEMBLY_ACC=CAM_ASM_000658 /LENGTH=176 /DNA_ID=CAMNT_0015405753 /DNA_START=1977 /DNA_END=2505 /DNA_ORIENTATION=-